MLKQWFLEQQVSGWLRLQAGRLPQQYSFYADKIMASAIPGKCTQIK